MSEQNDLHTHYERALDAFINGDRAGWIDELGACRALDANYQPSWEFQFMIDPISDTPMHVQQVQARVERTIHYFRNLERNPDYNMDQAVQAHLADIKRIQSAGYVTAAKSALFRLTNVLGYVHPDMQPLEELLENSYDKFAGEKLMREAKEYLKRGDKATAKNKLNYVLRETPSDHDLHIEAQQLLEPLKNYSNKKQKQRLMLGMYAGAVLLVIGRVMGPYFINKTPVTWDAIEKQLVWGLWHILAFGLILSFVLLREQYLNKRLRNLIAINLILLALVPAIGWAVTVLVSVLVIIWRNRSQSKPHSHI